LFGSSNRVRASFYLFLYTFYGFFSVSVSVSVKKTNQRDIIPFLKV
jgi:hypothetical protein